MAKGLRLKNVKNVKNEKEVKKVFEQKVDSTKTLWIFMMAVGCGLMMTAFFTLNITASCGLNFSSNEDIKNAITAILPSEQAGPKIRGTITETEAETTIATDRQQQQQHHMLSIKPLNYSLHPKWKLWTEMDETQQQQALEDVGVYLTKYGNKKIMPDPQKRQKIKHGNCEMVEFAAGHALCGPKPEGGCNFFSFGINDDPSFDVTLATDWGCRGFAGDPTVHHPSMLHPKVTFHNVGASMISDNEERKIDKGGTEDWWLTSMPKLRFWLGLEHVHIVKLDCEGCEFALARDMLREDPDFLKHVDQISIETHVSRTWLNTQEELYYFALHFALLEEAGFQLEWSHVFGCSKRHEVEGCIDDLERFGFPCGYKPWTGHPNVVIGRSCQDYLWKRY